MTTMRAKMRVNGMQKYDDDSERVDFTAVCPVEGYPEGGGDENNTYARFTPSADLSILIQNPNLWGKFNLDDEYYIDFNKAGDK